jgi:hypothetical protein
VATPEQQAILPPPPPGSPWKTKILWYLADTAATALVYQAFDYGVEIQPAQTDADDPDATVWMHIQMRFEDQVSQAAADDQMFTLDVVNYTGDFTDSTWTSADFAFVNNELSRIVGAFAAVCSTRYRFTGARYYRRAFRPYTDDKPFTIAGGPAHVWDFSYACTANGNMPPQVCTTLTEETPSRKHWGRMYSPTLGATLAAGGAIIDTGGRLAAGPAQSLGDAVEEAIENLWDGGFKLVVPTTSSGGVYNPSLPGDWSIVKARTLQAVTGLRIDDVVDSHRNRRHKFAAFRKTWPLAATARPGE